MLALDEAWTTEEIGIFLGELEAALHGDPLASFSWQEVKILKCGLEVFCRFTFGRRIHLREMDGKGKMPAIDKMLQDLHLGELLEDPRLVTP